VAAAKRSSAESWPSATAAWAPLNAARAFDLAGACSHARLKKASASRKTSGTSTPAPILISAE
jgi:hypothetical protein